MDGRIRLRPHAEERVDPGHYTEHYYLTSCEGFERFRESGGLALPPRLRHALELAALRPGQRLLDIGCGRGELVLQAARRRAHGFGIDYASAAARLARESLSNAPLDGRHGSAAIGRMDATRLAFGSATFDVVLMLDFVEHVPEALLRRSLAEAYRVLKPSGRLIVHTSPNRRFEELAYRRYVRHVHAALLAFARLLGLKGRLLNERMLPTGPTYPRNEYERRLHVNEQSPASLGAALRAGGFRRLRTGFWEPPRGPYYRAWGLSWDVHLLDAVRFLWPLSRFWPLDRLFSNHIWVVARRPAPRPVTEVNSSAR